MEKNLFHFKKTTLLFLPLFVFSFLLSLQTAFGQLQFANPVVYASNGGPDDVDIADFTGDGKPDILVVSGDILLFVNQGSGTFANQQSVIKINQPVAIASGDFHGDGKRDLLITDAGHTLWIYRGHGDGTFGTGFPILDTYFDYLPTVMDFSNDNILDISITNTDNTHTLLLGNGDGTFLNVGTQTTAGSNFDVAVADFNGDGLPDVATVTYDQALISVLINTGNGGFAPAVTYPAGEGSWKIVANDFNGDGKPDIAAGRLNQSTSILINNGDGTFTPGASISTQSDFLTTADYNGDGLGDIAGGHFGTPFNVFLGNKSGVLTKGGSFPAGGEAYGRSKSGDLNGDSKPDLVILNPDDQTISVVLNTSKPCSKPVISANGPTKFCSGDSVTLTAPVSASYLWNNGATSQSIVVKTGGAYTVTTAVAGGCDSLTSDTTLVTVTVCDTDGDGTPDSFDCDPRDPKSDKVMVCHKGHALCVSRNAVNGHLKHGDCLGNCKNGCTTDNSVSAALSVYSNPNDGHFTVAINNAVVGKGELQIIDAKGTLIEKRQIQFVKGGQTVQFNLAKKPGGLYLVKLIDENGVQTSKMIIQH